MAALDRHPLVVELRDDLRDKLGRDEFEALFASDKALDLAITSQVLLAEFGETQ